MKMLKVKKIRQCLSSSNCCYFYGWVQPNEFYFALDDSDVETEGTEDQQDLGHQSFESIPSAYTNGTNSPAPACKLRISNFSFMINV